MDAAALAQVVLAAAAGTRGPGALSVLARYERWRKTRVALIAPPSTFDRLLAHVPARCRVAQRGLSWVNRSRSCGAFFIRRALGMSGDCRRRRAGRIVQGAALWRHHLPAPSGVTATGSGPPPRAHEAFPTSAMAWVVKVTGR